MALMQRQSSPPTAQLLYSRQGQFARSCANGFTLLELMIALAIFSIIGVAMYTQFSQVMKSKEITDAHAKRLTEIQRAMAILERDFSQIVARTSRDEFGDPQPALKSSGESSVEFSRIGWSITPFANGNRSDIQRVRYEFEEGALVRGYWDHPDKGGDAIPHTGVVLTGVESLEISYWGVKKSDSNSQQASSGLQLQNSDQWPPLETSFDDNKSDPGIPKLIKIELELKKMGKITRLFSLVDSISYKILDPSN